MIKQILEFHFIDFPQRILHVWGNFLRFFAYFFSIPNLLKTFFSPWHRIAWEYPRGFDVGKILETLIGNLFSRFIGFLMRSILILVGIFVELLVFLFGALIFLLWYIAPIVFIFFFIFYYV